jgi:hypothetical protein
MVKYRNGQWDQKIVEMRDERRDESRRKAAEPKGAVVSSKCSE